MSSPTRYKKGDWKGVCDACGQRFLMSKLRLRWDGLMVCSKDWNPRQPQDFVRAKVDIQAVPVTRPESADTFIHPDGSIESDLAATLDSLDMEGLAYNQEPIVVDTLLTDETIVFVDAGATVTLPSAPTAPIEIFFPGAGGSASGGAGSFGGSGGSGLYAIPTPDGSGGFDWGIFNLPDCTVLQVPSTNDRGTSVFAGPAETAYGVPQTTVEITTVAETPCGLALRKTVTKTYSSRHETGEYVLAAASCPQVAYAVDYSPAPSPVSHGFVASATSNGCALLAANQLLAAAPSRYDYIPNPTYYSLKESAVVTIGVGAVLFGNYHNATRLGGSYSHFSTVPSIGDSYYLDVHEVWTYSVI